MLSSFRAIAPRRLSYLLAQASAQSTCAIPSRLAYKSPNSFHSIRQIHSSQILKNAQAAHKIEEDEDTMEAREEATFDEAVEETIEAAEDAQPEPRRSVGETIKSAVMSKLSSAPPMATTRNQDGVDMSFERLAKLDLVDKRLINTIVNDLKYADMTEVQVKTILPALSGGDVLAQAKTGTGKTLAFMLPTLHRIINSDRSPPRPRAIDIRCIVISPTRELAMQIAKETEVISRGTNLVIQVAVGGTGKSESVRNLRSRGCHILVATPGRLYDLLTDQRLGLDVSKLESLIFDEADTLLDQGFAEEIKRITEALPRPRDVDRQTLMFSATVTRAVQGVAKAVMKPRMEYINTISSDDVPTHVRVPQYLVEVESMENILPTVLEIVKTERKHYNEQPFKAIVFFNTTRAASLAYEVFNRLKSVDGAGPHPLTPLVLSQIHGKLSQEQRTRTAERFRVATSGILFASDVVARGMHFPAVTHVLQVGVPLTQESYIHRLGRTARGASTATGKGFLIISKMEHKEAVEIIRGLKLRPNANLLAYTAEHPTAQARLMCADIDMTKTVEVTRTTAETLTQITEAAKAVPYEDKEAMYLASMGYYAQKKTVAHRSLFKELARLCRFQWGMEDTVPVSPGLLSKMRIPINSAAEFDINIGHRSMGDRVSDSMGGGGRFQVGNGRGGRPSFGDRGSRGGFGDRPQRTGGFSRDKPSYGDRPQRTGGFNSDRPSYGDRPPRPAFGDRPSRGSFGDRPSRGSLGDRPSRAGFGGGGGDRPSYGDRPPRSDFGDRPSRGRGGGFGGGGRGRGGGSGGFGGGKREGGYETANTSY